MINIRYHIVSITAVFLALGIGVALGSTFLDRATVDVLERNIRSAENRIDQTNAENARLSAELDDARQRDEALILVGTEQLLADRLTDVPMVVVAAPGTEEEDTAALSTTLRQAGADLRGVLRMRDAMLFDGEEVDEGLATDLGVDASSVSELRTETYEQLRQALADAGAPAAEEGADPGSDPNAPEATPDGGESPTPDGTQPAVVTSLIDREYVSLEPESGLEDGAPILERTGYRYVFVGSPDLDEEQNEAMLELLGEGSGDEALPGTVVSATQAAPVGEEQPAPTVVALVRASDDLEPIYNTVDDVDWFAGLVATVFTVERMETAAPAHYGLSDGADAVIPEAP